MKKKIYLLTVVFTFLGLVSTQWASAQNVTISPKSGSLVSAMMDGNDTGYALMLSSLWRHEQLSLTMTASDRDGLTDGGEISKPGSVLGIRDNMLTIIGGHRPSFLVVSLPKGYRITGYRLTLINNLVGANVVPSQLPSGASNPAQGYRNLNNSGSTTATDGVTDKTMRFYETKPWTTDGTNSGCTGRSNNEGYDETQVRYLALGSDWANGQIGTTEDEVLAQAKNKDDKDGDINPTDDGKEFYMERFGDDMGNQLYFRLVKNYDHYGISIKSFEILFTAEGTFEADVTPEVVGAAQHVVKSPFLTSKLDIGTMSLNTDPNTGAQRYTYNENNVKDIMAYTYLYQQGAVKNGEPSEDVDIPARITPVRVDNKDLYALGNDTYFIETPIEVETQSGWPAPIGYRIIGATFNYLWGTDTDGGEITVPNAVYITYGSGNSARYLNTQLHFQNRQNNNNPYWQVDEYGNLYTGTDANRSYLSCYGDDDNMRVLHTSKSATGPAAKWNLRLDTGTGHIYYEDSHGERYIMQGQTTTSSDVYVVKNATTNLATYTQNGNATHTIEIPAFHPGTYTLNVYDKTGTTVVETIDVTADNAGSKPIVLSNLNNDAVKFQIANLDDGKQALVSITLQMQALDPYIDKMDIVCTDDNKVLELKQTFTANDFSVSGGKFIFYVPEDYAGQELTFTFKDLYSKYGDNTYYDGTGTHYGRYSYVTSEYFKEVDGDGDNGLYDTKYNPDASYENKVLTSVAGNIRFKFNNAEDLGEPGVQPFLVDTPFSVTTYRGTTDPDNPGASAEAAAFIPCKLKAVADADQNSDIYYVFTADETRYNIAPTTSWQHRAYAFYRMDIELRAKTFTPVITPTKVYDKTLYFKDGADAEDSMWGISLKTTDPEDGKEVVGYLSVQEILDHIKGREASGDNPAIPSILDENGENGPKSMKEILYIDGTYLKSILNSSKTESGSDTPTVLDLQTLRNEMAVNALIFLPENTTSTLDNVAYKTSGVTYHAGKNIVITDRQPFYSPYDIQVDPANRATYTREITWPKNGKTALATVILPFTLNITDGTHTEPDGTPYKGSAFTVNTMVADNCLSLENAEDAAAVNFKANAYFSPISGTTTEANKPYMINVTTAPNDPNVPFSATQFGALVKATTSGNGMSSEYLFNGESAAGTIAQASYSFQNQGSFSGKKLKASDGYFYFSGGMYLNSKNIRIDQLGDALYMYPFRGYYTYTGGSTAKMMTAFNVLFGENWEATGITELAGEADLVAIPGRGTITFKAAADNDVQIVKANGIAAGRVVIAAGETKTINVPSGLYIVNGAKLIVK